MQKSEICVDIANDCVNDVFSKYVNQCSYGDFMSAVSILIYNTALWVAQGMNEDPKETMNAIFAGAIQLDTIHHAEEK